MPIVTWMFIAVAAVLVVTIAFGAIGREAHRLDSIAPRASYQLDQAVEYVSEAIPVESQARLTTSEVEALLIVHLRWLHEHGLQPDDALDARQSEQIDVTIGQDDLVAALLGEADTIGVDLLDDVDAVYVVDAHLDYFERIGAVGDQIPLDDRL